MGWIRMEFDATCDRMGRSIDETRVDRGRFYRAAWSVGRRRVRVCAFGDYVRVVMMTCERVKVTMTVDLDLDLNTRCYRGPWRLMYYY